MLKLHESPIVKRRAYLFAKDAALSFFGKFSESPALAEKIMSVARERAEAVKLRENRKRIRGEEKISKFELRLIEGKSGKEYFVERTNELMKLLRERADLLLKMGEMNFACVVEGRSPGIHRAIAREFYKAALLSHLEVAELAKGNGNLYVELTAKGEALSLLIGKLKPLGLDRHTYKLGFELQEELPGLEKRYADAKSQLEFQKHGN